MIDEIDEILQKRGEEYGDFEDVAFTYDRFQEIKTTRNPFGGVAYDLAPRKIMALDMIFAKISRILNGNSDNIDSWMDIAGYAKLVADAIKTHKDYIDSL